MILILHRDGVAGYMRWATEDELPRPGHGADMELALEQIEERRWNMEQVRRSSEQHHATSG